MDNQDLLQIQMELMSDQKVNTNNDRFKQQLFNSKKNQYKQKYLQSRVTRTQKLREGIHLSNNQNFKRIIILNFFILGLYISNKKYKLSSQITEQIESFQFNPISKAAFSALIADFRRRVTKLDRNNLDQEDRLFANYHFESELNILYRTLKQRQKAKKISEQICHGKKWGPFKINNQFTNIFVNKEGHVAIRREKCKLQILGIKFFGAYENQILQYQNTFNVFNKNGDIDMIAKCNMINSMNKLFLQHAECQIILQQCIKKSTIIYNKSMEIINKEKEKAQQNKKIELYLIKF